MTAGHKILGLSAERNHVSLVFGLARSCRGGQFGQPPRCRSTNLPPTGDDRGRADGCKLGPLEKEGTLLDPHLDLKDLSVPIRQDPPGLSCFQASRR